MKSSGGPCCHCGSSETPCWRKGPPEKPVLCNACGIRWLVKGCWDGYLPGRKDRALGVAGGLKKQKRAASKPQPVVTTRPAPQAAPKAEPHHHWQQPSYEHRFPGEHPALFFHQLAKGPAASFLRPASVPSASATSTTTGGEQGYPSASEMRDPNTFEAFSHCSQEPEVSHVDALTAAVATLLQAAASKQQHHHHAPQPGDKGSPEPFKTEDEDEPAASQPQQHLPQRGAAHHHHHSHGHGHHHARRVPAAEEPPVYTRRPRKQARPLQSPLACAY